VFDERRTGLELRYTVPSSKHVRMRYGFRSEEVSSSYLQGTRSIGGGILEPIGDGSSSGGSWSRETGNDELDEGRDTFNPGDLTDNPGPGDTAGPIVVAAPLHPGGRLASFTVGRTSDTRDLINNPTKGHYTDFGLEYAGSILGGETPHLQEDQRRGGRARGKAEDRHRVRRLATLRVILRRWRGHTAWVRR